MSDSPALIMLEFNELCPSLLQHFMDAGVLPGFRRLYETSLVCTTTAAEEPPQLEPWIQWPTVHSGLTYAEHGIFNLGDGRRLTARCIAQLASDAGLRVGVFGSMNLNYHDLNGYLVPDAWEHHGKTQPASLQPFFEFVSRQVQESSQATPIGKADLARFIYCLLRNGISSATVTALARQLAAEYGTPDLRWRRPSLLDRIQYDVFRSLNRKHRVQFATLFCNSTAHYQHYYWRNMQPELFDVPPLATDHPSLKNAILYGYQQMDHIVGRVLRDYPKSLVMLLSALSQQPWTDTTKCTFRPRSFGDFLSFCGAPAGGLEVKPVMAEEFYLSAQDAATADDAEARLRELTVDGKPLMRLKRTGNDIFCGCAITTTAQGERTIRRASDGATRPFAELMASVHSVRSGRHHPDGIWWMRCGQHKVLDKHVPLTSVAPTVLAYLGLEIPSSMSGEPLAAMPSHTAVPMAV